MKKHIEISSVTCLRGPNMWTYRPVLEARVDIGALEDSPSNTIPGFYERLTAWIPSLSEHRCSYGEPGGFLQRLREGTWPGHILEHVTLELQNLAGMPGGFGRARETSVRGVYKVVVRSWHETVTEHALRTARDLVMAAIDDRHFDVDGAVAGLRRLTDELCLGPSTASIVNAAEARRIPAIRISDGNLVQLGHGASQHRIWTAESDLTSAIAQGIARDKDLARGLLRACGLPVARGRRVNSADDAWEEAQDHDGPVVVKPNDPTHGRAVFLEVTTRGDVAACFAIADRSSYVVVEEFIPGDEHRLLVIGGKMIAAARGKPASVRGDGERTVAQLIETQINAERRRGTAPGLLLAAIEIDEVVNYELARQGHSLDAVPPAGTEIVVRRIGNLTEDVTDIVHPAIARAAVLAAKTVGLDIAGVDFVAEDISRALDGQHAAIVAVNSGPGLLPHLQPASGAPRPVGQAIVDHLFPETRDGRIPLVGITGTAGTAMIARLVARLLLLTGRRVGLACSRGLFLDRRQVERGDCANWEAAHRLLLNRSVEAAVCENHPYSMVAEGLAYDRCTVAIVTEIDPEARIEEFDILTADQMYNVLRTQVDIVLASGTAVLNAADPFVAKMASVCDGRVIYFAEDRDQPVLRAHLESGGRAVFARAGKVVRAEGSSEKVLAGLKLLGVVGTHPDVRLVDVLATVAAAWALDVPSGVIRVGIESFDPADGLSSVSGF